ncbi:MAG TPA: tRNA (adenosine(37)-N6)-threonylcarbamoyltransferase complex ATPase subunit type 1 TsaE [Cyclobacteriaceae bacterium]|jgi:tRNA threonylcarbamoyladenosine biosynthesis protein TsaE
MVEKAAGELEIKYHSINELPSISKEIIDFAENIKVWLFYGEMGIGKTTLIKEICSSLSVKGSVTSPTFNIVNEYFISDSKKINHFDFYRIENEIEAMDIGYEEYFYSGNLCLIEWPDQIPNLLPEVYLKIVMSKESDLRKIQITRND